MTIAFDQVPIDILVPGQYIESSATAQPRGVIGVPSRICVFAQRLTTGRAAALTPVRITSLADCEGLPGRGSQGHRMLRALWRANDWSELWAIFLDDLGAGAAAAGSILFGGSATAAGTTELLIHGVRVPVGVASGASAATIATAAAAAINAVTDLGLTAAVDGTNPAKVNTTARHKGECGNSLDIRINYYDGQYLPAGVTVTITSMAGGTGSPDLSTAIAKLGDVWYSDFVSPYTDAPNLSALEAECSARENALRAQDAFAWTAASGTLGSLLTLGASRNSKYLAIWGGGKSPTPPDELAAVAGGVAAFHLKEHPSRPLTNLALPGVLAPAPADRWTLQERQSALASGISTAKVDPGGNVMIDRPMTTYRTNGYGYADAAWRDPQRLRQIATARLQFGAEIAGAYPRAILAQDGNAFGAGQPVATPRGIKGTLVAAYAKLIDGAIAQDMETFKSESIVEIDSSDPNRANALLMVTFVGALLIFAARIKWSTGSGGQA